MKIEVLYFDGCPGYAAVLPRIEALVSELGVDAEVEPRRVESPEEVDRERFLGSPTVRVDGRDVDPTAAERTDYGFKCRLYRWPGGTAGAPPDEWLREAIAGAAGRPAL